MEEYKMNEDFNINNPFTYDKTVCAKEEDLAHLPEEFKSIWNQYQDGNLPNTTEEELQKLLFHWFGTSINTSKHLVLSNEQQQFETSISTTDTGFITSRHSKRQRGDSDF